MKITLRHEEVELLEQILSNYLSDLRSEISNTEKYELREALKRQEETVKDLIARLQQAGVPGS